MNEDRCKEQVFPRDRYGSFHPHQCERKAVEKGFCRQHGPSKAKTRQEHSDRLVAITDLEYRLKDAAAEIVRTVLVEPFSGLPKPVRGAREAYWRIEADLNAAKGKAK